MQKNKKLLIIAGPCMIDENNIKDIYKISEITITDENNDARRAIFGVRVVGLKSRTALNIDQHEQIGIDYSTFEKNMSKIIESGSFENLDIFPSHIIAEKFIRDTGMIVATEIMDPLIQLSSYEKTIPKGKLFIWNPAVNQLGWPIMIMGDFAKRNNWYLGLKNGKWLGKSENTNDNQTPMEKSWQGLISYSKYHTAKEDSKVMLIHRGVEVENKGDYRSLPVHEVAKRAKLSSGAKLFFDPSHSLGPKLRDNIVNETVEAMKIMIDSENYLYDGILIETGQSQTDTNQHITIDELNELCQRISKFRILN